MLGELLPWLAGFYASDTVTPLLLNFFSLGNWVLGWEQ